MRKFPLLLGVVLQKSTSLTMVYFSAFPLEKKSSVPQADDTSRSIDSDVFYRTGENSPPVSGLYPLFFLLCRTILVLCTISIGCYNSYRVLNCYPIWWFLSDMTILLDIPKIRDLVYAPTMKTTSNWIFSKSCTIFTTNCHIRNRLLSL